MKIITGLILLTTSMPYMVCAGAAAGAAAAAASNGNGGSSAAVASSTGFHTVTLRCNCPSNYDPVCGTDGRTYSNECGLRCVNQYNLKYGFPVIRLHHEGECSKFTCQCPKIDKPICGSNNHTYPNECYLNCENIVRARDGLYPILINYPGPCRKPTCVCPDYINPVCGTDGKTYQNVCIMQCHSRVNQAQGLPPIYVKENGACKNELCSCPLKENELCASDDNTYLNDCMLECQNRRRHQLGQAPLTIKHRGKCPIKCICTTEYAPVCTKNDITFSNYCQFRCENERRKAGNLPPLVLRWYGRCDCDCSNDFAPVCASNKKTYQNRCQLRCLNRKLEQDGYNKLRFLYSGVCKKCDCNYCGGVYKPVCGSDRNTYWNDCWLDCNIKCRAAADYLWKYRDGECL